MRIPVAKIYEICRVPPNLQRHMLRAAAVGDLIANAWDGPPVSRENVVTTLLIHDMGNIVKADYEGSGSAALLEEEARNIDYWKEVQADVIRKYGSDDHEVTHLMARELGFNERVLELLRNKIFILNEATAASDDWELKVCAYADQRIGPFGILSLEDRFDELRKRYGDRPNSSINHPRSEALIRAAYEIERQVMKHCSISPTEISDDAIRSLQDTLRNYEVTVEAAGNAPAK